MLKRKIFTNTFFNILSQIVSFLFGIVLARMLFPSDFGVYGISLLIIEISTFLTLRKFSIALVQIKEIKDEYYHVVFSLNLLISIVFTFIIFFLSPYLANFFKMQQLSFLLRWHAIALIIMSFELISSVKLSRTLKFKELGLATISSVFLNGVVSLIFVNLKFGPVSLVFGYLTESLTTVLICLYFVKGIKIFPRLNFGMSVFKKLSHVGVGSMLQQIFNYLAANMDYFWLGKLSSATELGFYTRAYKLMSIPIQQISRNISQVLLPAFSRIQDNHKEIENKLFKATQTTTLVAFPIFLIGYIYAPSLIYFIYGEKWMSTVGPLKLLIIAGAIKSVSTYLGDVLKSKGIVYRELVVQMVYASIIGTGGYFAVRSMGMIGMSLVVVMASLVFFLFMSMVLFNVLKIAFVKYLRIFIPAIFICFTILSWSILLEKITNHYSYRDFNYLLIGIGSNFILYILSVQAIKNKCLLNKEINLIQHKIINQFFPSKQY